jgi:antitoxin component YwqK of YwqJK toxin-antitoxin module
MAILMSVCLAFASCSSQEYNRALELIEKGEYEEAKAIFEKLGDYKDSEKLLARFIYIPTLVKFNFSDKSGQLAITLNEDNLPSTFQSSGIGSNKFCQLSYNENGNVTKQTVTDNLIGSTASFDYTHDEYGNTITAICTGFDGKVTKNEYEYDANGKKLMESFYEANEARYICTYTYDENEKMTRMEYDTVSNGVYVYDYSYDANGNQIKEVCSFDDQVLSVIEFFYDDNGNMTKEIYSEEGFRYTVVYTYDEKGNLTREDYSDEGGDSANVTYSYDPYGNITKEVFTQADGGEESIENQYVLVYVPYDFTKNELDFLAIFWDVHE